MKAKAALSLRLVLATITLGTSMLVTAFAASWALPTDAAVSAPPFWRGWPALFL